MTRRPAEITSLIELKPQTIGLICRFHVQSGVRREVAEKLGRLAANETRTPCKKLATSLRGTGFATEENASLAHRACMRRHGTKVEK